MIQNIQNFDLSIFNWTHSLAGKSRLLDFFGIIMADYSGYLLVLIAFILFLSEADLRKKFSYYATLVLSVIFSRGIITEFFRFVYTSPRPFAALNFSPLVNGENGNSFPSGHAAFFFAIAGTVWLFNKKWGRRFLGVAVLMGLARIFAGVHWPSDILGGAIIGLFSAWLADRTLSAKK